MKPDDWELVDATAAEVEMQELLYALVRMLKPKLVVETGTYQGHSTSALGRACQTNRRGRVVSCDPNVALVELARWRCRRLPVEIRCCRSADLPELAQADFMFCDSDYSARQSEMARAKIGAVVVIHDTRVSYDSEWPPLAGAVEALGGITFPTYRGFGLLVKKSPTGKEPTDR